MNFVEEYDYTIKVIVAGDYCVGKSSIVKMFCFNNFIEQYTATIGVDFCKKILEVDGKRIKLQIWDTAGQEKFRKITSTYYRGSHVVILVCDMTNLYSFLNLKNWIKDIKIFMNSDAIKIILVANKSDDIKKRKVSKEELDGFAIEQNLEYIEVSAKQNINIDLIFRKIAEIAIETYKNYENIINNVNITVHNNNKPNKSKRKLTCCKI